MTDTMENKVADAVRTSWVYRLLPERFWPFAQLARWERPIGWWLLMWPCWWSLMLAVGTGDTPGLSAQTALPVLVCLALFMLGAVAMRGAGCTYNDLVDQDIDDQVARTRSRPLPSGRVTRNQAMVFLVAQALAGLVILLQFNRFTVALGCLSLVTVVIYPFMKRITWWPQLFLGLAFSWGALMGWPAWTGQLGLAPLALYLGSIFWVIGYDTIYAHQDIEDDALVGVKSTARLFGENTKTALIALYGAAWLLFALAWFLVGVSWPAWAGLALGAAQMAWQITTLDIRDPAQCLKLFKSNSHFGWILFGGLVVAALVAV
ncbi:MAG: 4-hydroxybenzoate octaprenyltransferase [Nitratireductor sp.]|nr:4-hydroxybenzoate octaprenyltransferase [Nitratireductor sp.]